MKTNQFRAMVFALLMAVISLATVSAQAITVSGWNSACRLFGTDKGYYERYGDEHERSIHDSV
jgi:hypothetical protein